MAQPKEPCRDALHTIHQTERKRRRTVYMVQRAMKITQTHTAQRIVNDEAGLEGHAVHGPVVGNTYVWQKLRMHAHHPTVPMFLNSCMLVAYVCAVIFSSDSRVPLSAVLSLPWSGIDGQFVCFPVFLSFVCVLFTYY